MGEPAPNTGTLLPPPGHVGFYFIPTLELVSPFSTGPTTKVRRHFVAQKYKRLIESFYH